MFVLRSSPHCSTTRLTVLYDFSTSWKTGGGAKATFGGTIEGGKNGRNAIVPRASKFKKKNGFAT